MTNLFFLLSFIILSYHKYMEWWHPRESGRLHNALRGGGFYFLVMQYPFQVFIMKQSVICCSRWGCAILFHFMHLTICFCAIELGYVVVTQPWPKTSGCASSAIRLWLHFSVVFWLLFTFLLMHASLNCKIQHASCNLGCIVILNVLVLWIAGRISAC